MMNLYSMHESVKENQSSIQFLAQQRLDNQTATTVKPRSWTRWFSIKA